MFEIEMLKKQKPKKYPLSIIFAITLTILTVLSFYIKTYDSYNTFAITNQEKNSCNLELQIPYTQITDTEKSLIEYENNIYKINKINYEDTIIEDDVIYKKINLSSNINCNSKVTKIKLLYNKQRILTKILKIIKEE